MPEIPEIETVKRHLESKVGGKTIVRAIVNRVKSLNVTSEEFTNAVEGRTVTGIRRRAKQLVLLLSNDRSIVVHFMLEGYIRLYYKHEQLEGKPSLAFELNTDEKLGFYKLNLGYAHLADTVNLEEIEELAGIGPEPLAEDFTEERFVNLLERRKGMIKPLLMEQQFIAGIGNVYSNETLFCAGILPERKVSNLKDDEKKRLYQCIRDILTRSIALGGVYEEKFSSDDNLTGGFESKLQVAYRTGQPCYRCGRAVETKRVGGRNAFYCPVCQK